MATLEPLSRWEFDTCRWMEFLDEKLTFDKLSIPGTHDSGTEKAGQGPAHTQNFDIGRQLNDGIRFLDIRASNIRISKNDPLEIKHGSIDCWISFGDVLKCCSAFLKHNPQETIIMLMDDAHDRLEIGRTVEDGFKKYLKQQCYEDLFYLGTEIPPLKKLRGKVVLFRRFESQDCDNMGVDLEGIWKDNATFSVTTPQGVTFSIEDEYKKRDTHKKEATVRSVLDSAIDSPKDGVLHITYNSIASGSHTPYQYAWGGGGVNPAMNRSLRAYLAEKSGIRRFGVVMLDFYNNKGSDRDIVESIIRSNPGIG